MIYSLISVFMAAIPFFIWQEWGDGFRYPKEVLSIVAFTAIIGSILYLGGFKRFKHKYLLLFLGWCVVISFFSPILIPVYLGTIVLQMPSLVIAWKELCYLSLAVFTIVCISSGDFNHPTIRIGNIYVEKLAIKDYVIQLAKVISVCVIIMSAYSIVQAIGLDEFFRCASHETGWRAGNPLAAPEAMKGAFSHRIVGTIANPSILSAWLAICLPFGLFLRSKLGYTAFALGLVVVCLTQSAIGALGAGVGIFIYMFFHNRKIALILLCLLITAGTLMFVFKADKLNSFLNPMGRIECHKEAFNLLKEKPLTGLGLGSFEYLIGGNPEIVSRLHNQNWKELHDEPGQIFFSAGLIGLTLFLAFIAGAVREFFGNITKEGVVLFSSLAAFLVMSIGIFTFRISPISFYGVIFTGLFLKTIGEKT